MEYIQPIIGFFILIYRNIDFLFIQLKEKETGNGGSFGWGGGLQFAGTHGPDSRID